jgi:hypothetical protein
MYQADGNYTHYLYYQNETGPREPTGLLCLNAASQETRRVVLHNAMKNGEFLAPVPRPVVSMKDLRNYLKACGR